MKNGLLSRSQSGGKSKLHSKLAMKAARNMSRTRLKQKTGRRVCHHLKMMLESQVCAQSRPVARSNENLLQRKLLLVF